MYHKYLSSLWMKGNSGAGQIVCASLHAWRWRLTLDDAIKGRHESVEWAYQSEQT